MTRSCSRYTLPALVALLTGACATVPAPPPGPAPVAARPHSGYTAHRVYDVANARFTDFEAFSAHAAGADVVFFGEQHGLAPGHRMQHALLETLARRGGATLSLEMFERDVAPLVDAYVAGSATSAQLASGARPWPRYASDYQPTVDFARGMGWRVVAANVPRAVASLVARAGLGGLDSLNAATRAHAAAELRCPEDAYRTRFIEEMRKHPMGPPGSPEEEAAREQRYYESQCVKDETMAESIVRALEAGVTRPVVHLTGAFHSDHGDGIPARVLRRAPGTTITSVTVIPVADLDAIDVTAHTARASYLLFVLQPPR